MHEAMREENIVHPVTRHSNGRNSAGGDFFLGGKYFFNVAF
jgi:hypothetical protein